MNTTALPLPSQDAFPRIDIAGFLALADPHAIPNYPNVKSRDEQDRRTLEKLHQTGFDVTDLDDAHNRYKISPIREVNDLWKVLGYTAMPMVSTGSKVARFTHKQLTALVLPYPDPQKPGEPFPYDYYLRLRWAEAVRAYDPNDHTYKEFKYQQRSSLKSGSSNEAYWLMERMQWDRLYDVEQPLVITEGELKACALGLAQVASIGFGGSGMWRANKKAGVGRLHPTLDPKGPRAEWAIPIAGRTIFVIPDQDYLSNKQVKADFLELCNVLNTNGAGDVYFVSIPNPPKRGAWKGIDDYLTFHLKPRWAGDFNKVKDARRLLQELFTKHARKVKPAAVFKASSLRRITDDMLEAMSTPEQFSVIVQPTGNHDVEAASMLYVYRNDRYVPVDMGQSANNTNGKVCMPSLSMQREVSDRYYAGLVEDAEESGEALDDPPSMPADLPNKVGAALLRQLPITKDNRLLNPMPNVGERETCLRIKGALINLNKCLASGADWEKRSEWLLPPSHNWFSSTQIQVSLSNLEHRPECPLFLEMLNHAFAGDQQRIRCLQLFFGKVVTNPLFMGLQKFLCLYGPGGTGKSTLYRLLLLLVGEQNVAELLATRSSESRFNTSMLPGKSLIVFPETPDHFTTEMGAVIKAVTGEDRIYIEAKGRRPASQFIPADILTVGNHPPTIPMEQSAFRRRAVFLAMTEPIVDRNKIIEQKMQDDELAGIVLWALDGAAGLARGEAFVTPNACLDDWDDIVEGVAPEERFINTCVVKKDKGMLTPNALYEAYLEWRNERHLGRGEGGVKKLSYLIRQKFRIKSTVRKSPAGKSERVYIGLALGAGLGAAID